MTKKEKMQNSYDIIVAAMTDDKKLLAQVIEMIKVKANKQGMRFADAVNHRYNKFPSEVDILPMISFWEEEGDYEKCADLKKAIDDPFL